MDIAKKKTYDTTIREETSLIRIILESLPVGIMLVKPDDHRIALVNKMTCSLFGAPAEQIVGRECHDFICPAERGCCPITDLGQVIDQAERQLIGSDRREIPVLKSVIEIQYNGESHLLESFIDITERKHLEAQAVHSKKLESIGQLAAGIAHEINTPTQFVNDNLRFLQDSFSDIKSLISLQEDLKKAIVDESKAKSILAEIECIEEAIDLEFLLEDIPNAIVQGREGAGRIAEIVAAMKAFSYPGQSEKVAVDINEAIRTTVTVTRSEWKYVAELELDLADDLPMVQGYLGDINQAMLNIIVNAAHAIAEKKEEQPDFKGLITISTRLTDDWLEIHIGDNGPGVPENILDCVFDPFFTTKEVGKGTGQGLTIAQKVVEGMHSGKLRIETEKDRGSTFIILLPL